MDALEGPGAWQRLPATPKQLLRDNAMTLIGQVSDKRPPFSKADAEAIKTPTLFIGGANTKGMLPKVLHTLAANVKFEDRDDPRRHPSDVRAGAAEISAKSCWSFWRDDVAQRGSTPPPVHLTSSDRAAVDAARKVTPRI